MVPQNRSNDPSPLCCHPPVVESFPLPSAPACPGLLCPGVKNEKWWQGAGTSQQELVLSAKIGALVLGWYSRVLFSAHVHTYRTTSTFDSDCTSASQAEVGSSSDHLERKYSPCSYFYPEMSKSKFEFWIVQLLLFLQFDCFWYWYWCQYWCRCWCWCWRWHPRCCWCFSW